MFPEMHKTFPSSFPGMWYFLKHADVFFFYKVQNRSEGMTEDREY